MRETSTMSLRGWVVVVLSLCSLGICIYHSPAFAQETTAGMQGVVKDQTGAVVVGATVEVSSNALIGTKKLETDHAGAYRFTNLPPGQYTLSVSMTGFRMYKQAGIILDVGRLPTIDVHLQIGTVTETVEVSAQAPIVDVTQSKVAVTVSQDELLNIPKGRSFQTVIPFAPGARQEPLQSSRADVGRANGFQIDGASDSENVYLVEGMNTTDIENGGIRQNIPFEFVQEVQIKSSSFEAEYGGALGGVVNVVQKHGSPEWHGTAVTYYRSDALNANDQCLVSPAPNSLSLQQIRCGLRGNPATSQDSSTRTDQTPQYYIQKKDGRRIVEPGLELGGPLFKNHLWLFASYIPQIDRLRRTVNFTGKNPGPRTLVRSFDQHNALTRLDYSPFSKLRLFGSWLYGYSRRAGLVALTPDSAFGQKNVGASTDPSTLRSDTGSVNPASVWTFGGDWTPTSRAVVALRYGYWFYDNQDRGKPVGIRYEYLTDVNIKTLALDSTADSNGNCISNCIPLPFQNTAGFSNIQSNLQNLFDAFRRKSLSTDFSYFVSKWGTHNFKLGYGNNRLSNDLFTGFNTAFVRLNYTAKYSPGTPQGDANCKAIIAANVTQFGPSAAGLCRGRVGFFMVRDGVDQQGQVSSYNHAFYIQDSWTVGKGLTFNAGVRLDKEFLPPYSPGADSISFDFTDKVAPRVGVAYDVLHNGKLKAYFSYGKFFDIMKYSLPRGSFGGEYWHDCVYAMEDADFNKITPTAPGGHGCPVSGPAPGVTVGRFIENQDFRKNVISTTDPGVDPNIKPMEQHEYVVGADWAIKPSLGLEIRYARKILDRTIEDIGITDNLGFFIGNPGPGFGDLLHRFAAGLPAQCPTCPAQPSAIRNYNAVEFRLTKRPSARWYGSISYTYSRLRGNYSGLTDSDVTDGNGGRHSPNNHRAFDQPQMQFTAHGTFQDGPLSTDRPHALKMIGWYRLKWLGMESTFGLIQVAFSGTPVSTCWPTINTASSCVFVENRGGFVKLHRDAATGNIVSDGIIGDFRTPAFTQTDFAFTHEFRVSKTNERLRLGFEWNIQNLLNQRNALSIHPQPLIADDQVKPAANNQTGIDWKLLLTGWDYIGLSNQQKTTFNNLYGLPFLFQSSRTMRLKVKFSF